MSDEDQLSFEKQLEEHIQSLKNIQRNHEKELNIEEIDVNNKIIYERR